MKLLPVIFFFLALAVARAVETAPLPDGLYAEITTPRGVFTAELFFQKTPLTVASFVGLAEGTLGPKPRKPYFDGVTFHRVVTGFVVQGGDPLGNGSGGPGYDFPDEFVPGLRHDAAGMLSMANSGPDSNGSQFFVTLAPVNRLNYLHSVFGRVVRGLEVLPQIKERDPMTVKILRQGLAAREFRADDAAFAALLARVPRATPAAFDDANGLLQTDPPRAKILNHKLSNFTRFNGARLYARLFEKFDPQLAGQTPAQFVESLADSLQLGPKGVLVVWFAQDNQWHLVQPGYGQLKLLTPSPWPALAPEPPPSPDAVQRDEQRRLLAALNDVVDGLIYQLEAAGR